MALSKEQQAAFSGPAIVTDRVVVTLGTTVRIAFLEQGVAEAEPQFRVATSMSREDAKKLAELLLQILKQTTN